MTEKFNGEPEQTTALSATVEDLAALEAKTGEAMIQKRMDILQLARRGSIGLTHANDWTLFKNEAGVYGYLQDSGCERLADIWGIEITNVSDFTKEPQEDGSILYVITGDGYSRLTRRKVEKVLGARDTASMQMGRKELNGIKLQVETMKAARSNLDGAIVRHLAGLASVPIEELHAILRTKPVEDGFNKGAGFGSQAERHGGAEKSDYGPPPNCPKCNAKMRLFDKDPNSVYFGCPNYKTCGQRTIPAKKKPVESTAEAAPEAAEDEKPVTVGGLKNDLVLLVGQLITPEERQSFKKLIMQAKTIEELTEIQKQLNAAIPAKGGEE